ncbi:MAG: hypothetical protein CENE_02932 [Candidatus Celerinatantimonas neptuna]|nr:MAG: hypothetical protein CENE_02932 [Candidatus Celerinatantimonas neptuna]
MWFMKHIDLAFVHTSPVHIQTFERLHKRLASRLDVAHFVYESWLSEAACEVTASLMSDMKHQFSVISQQADLTVCTCSTLGGIAEEFSLPENPIQRIDRAMAEQAVCYDRVGVLACLEATLEPTSQLLLHCAQQRNRHPEIQGHLVQNAWQLFQNGDHVQYGQAISDAIYQISSQVDVIVLAQASMATVLPFTRMTIPILASPETGFVHALKTLDLLLK